MPEAIQNNTKKVVELTKMPGNSRRYREKGMRVYAACVPFDFEIGSAEGKAGDYLVQRPGLKPLVMKPKDFLEKYEPDD